MTNSVGEKYSHGVRAKRAERKNQPPFVLQLFAKVVMCLAECAVKVVLRCGLDPALLGANGGVVPAKLGASRNFFVIGENARPQRRHLGEDMLFHVFAVEHLQTCKGGNGKQVEFGGCIHHLRNISQPAAANVSVRVESNFRERLRGATRRSRLGCGWRAARRHERAP